ncbi:MAG TPA: glycoside hydrolase family 99-like domain-containing protein, partial [Bacteroidales bacterium]|nr:glycoside hydrolase family 99-like domain-containing protein [Bacteroidales bacterium]
MNDVRLIAFYLPQYHPIPENDAWWGTGFTEWTNVTAARPVFPGHYQPHLPADLGFYDLRVPEVREAQAQLARDHGIYGFCYYYYYFNGKRLLHRPLDDMLASGKPDFPFCLCWANENWTRQWDGHHDDILIRQAHSVADDRRFIRSILPALKDPRYIRVDNRLLLLVYRPELLPEPAKTAEIWRSVVRKETGADLYICAVNNFIKDIDPRPLGYDATVQFPLDYTEACKIDKATFAALHQTDPASLAGNWLINFPTVVRHMVNIKKPGFTFFRGAFPSWDNTARRADASTVYMHSSPELYKLYLKAVIGLTKRENAGDANLVFLNAWNEWAEGAHLEPDKKYGLRFLRATRDALQEETDLEATMKEIDDIDTESRIFYSAAAGLQEQVTAAGNRIHDLIIQADSEREEYQRQLAELNASLAEKEHVAATLAQLIESKDRQIAAKDAQLLASETILQEKETLAQQKESHLATLAEQIGVLEARLKEKDDRITAREDQLQEKEDLIRAKEEQLQTKESLVQSKEDQLREREDRIRELDVRLHEQLDRITDLTSRAAGLEIQLLATENRLDVQTHLTEDVQLKLAAELSEVSRLKDLLEASGDRIQSLLQTVSEREQANRELEAELETRQLILLGKEREISDLESHLREVSDQLARAEELIREKESAITTLGQQVADLQAVIQDRTQRIGELETALLEKVRKVDSLNELLGRRDEEIRRLNNRMQALLTSLSWKITRPLRRSLDILFSIFYFFCPFGSK